MELFLATPSYNEEFLQIRKVDALPCAQTPNWIDSNICKNMIDNSNTDTTTFRPTVDGYKIYDWSRDEIEDDTFHKMWLKRCLYLGENIDNKYMHYIYLESNGYIFKVCIYDSTIDKYSFRTILRYNPSNPYCALVTPSGRKKINKKLAIDEQWCVGLEKLSARKVFWANLKNTI